MIGLISLIVAEVVSGFVFCPVNIHPGLGLASVVRYALISYQLCPGLQGIIQAECLDHYIESVAHGLCYLLQEWLQAQARSDLIEQTAGL